MSTDMARTNPESDNRRGGFGTGGPQDGPIDAGEDVERQNRSSDILESGGVGEGELGQGGQRHPGGSSRNSAKER